MRILLTHDALHLMPVKAADIISVYLQAPISEKRYIFCGPEFGLDNVGKQAKIVRDLYGVKSAGSYFWHHIRSYMAHLVFESSKADPDVWMWRSVFKDGDSA